jgi:hypothetical protein
MCLSLSLCASPQVDKDGEVACLLLTSEKMHSVTDRTQAPEPLAELQWLEDQRTVGCASSSESPASSANDSPAECTEGLRACHKEMSRSFTPSVQPEDQSTEAGSPSSLHLKMKLEDQSTEGCTPSCSPLDSPRSSLLGNDASTSDAEFMLTPREIQESRMTELMLDMIYRGNKTEQIRSVSFDEETQSLESFSERSSDSKTTLCLKCCLSSFSLRKSATAGKKRSRSSMSMSLCSAKRTLASQYSRRVSMTLSTAKRSMASARQYRSQRRSAAIASR